MKNRSFKPLDPEQWEHVSDIPDFPFGRFVDMRKAVKEKRWSLGIDSLAAGYWASLNDSFWKRTAVKGLSLTLVAVAMLVVIASFDLREYAMLLTIPAMAAAFYLAEPSLPGRQYLTFVGVLLFVAFIGCLVQGYPRIGIVLGLSTLVFICVRAASFISVTSFRKALVTDEHTFLEMYAAGGVTLRDNESGRVFLNNRLIQD
ncbi:MAG TPA: hypothetical protein VFC63_21635 [Blastocatellia bacterium]|nr:hypothetical protein [Blastocatellia bacterium]